MLITKQFPEKIKEFLKPCLKTATHHAFQFFSYHMLIFDTKEVDPSEKLDVKYATPFRSRDLPGC